MQLRLKVVLSIRVGVSGVLCHLDLSTDTTRHDYDLWFCSVLSSGLIDGFFGLNVGEIYPVLICVLYVITRGLKSKIESLKEIIIEEKPEVIGLVETMLDGKDKIVMEGYTIYRNDRNGDRGGVLIAIKVC